MSDNFLIGQDASHHNPCDAILDNAAFVWLKSTEGWTYTDPSLQEKLEHIAVTRADDLPIMGFYHYARPENNAAETEVLHYLKVIKPHIGSCLMALDWEGNSLNMTAKKQSDWINTFCRQVKSRTGVMPFLYISESPLMSIKAYLDTDIPLWIAKYGSKPAAISKKHPLMWQFTSSPTDLDLWYGTKAQLASYAIK